MAASDHLSPGQFFHASHSRNRESIRQHGILTRFSDDEDMHTAGDPTVYVSRGVQPDDRWHGQDVWKVNMRGLPMQEDLEPGDFSTWHDIGPDRVSLYKRAEDWH